MSYFNWNYLKKKKKKKKKKKTYLLLALLLCLAKRAAGLSAWAFAVLGVATTPR